MPSNDEARLEFLRHEKDEWEEFFAGKRWKAIVSRGQEQADVLQNKLLHMPVKSLEDVIQMLDTRARLVGVLANSMIPSEIAREVQDEITQLSTQGE